MTNLSVHSLVFHLPGYHAGSKTTQICSEECCVHSVQYPTQMAEESCSQERGVCRGSDMIWDLVKGLIQKNTIWLFIFYAYVLYFIMRSAMERDAHTLRLMRCVVSLLTCLKPLCLICMIAIDWVHWEKLVSYCSYNTWEDIYIVFWVPNLVWNMPAVHQGHNLKNFDGFPNSTKIRATAILSAKGCK